jgi:hypothetical protein
VAPPPGGRRGCRNANSITSWRVEVSRLHQRSIKPCIDVKQAVVGNLRTADTEPVADRRFGRRERPGGRNR